MAQKFKQMMTGIDGQTLDPARVIGYGSAIAGVGAFVFNSVWSVVHTGVFDAQSYGIGLGAVFAGILAIAAGVSVKAHTEPPAKEL